MTTDTALVREATTDDILGIARVHVDTWRTAYRGIVPGDFLATLTYEGKESLWTLILSHPTPKSCVYVAEDEQGQVVGFASGGPIRTQNNRYKGELNAIYILESHQGKGIGRQLVSAIANSLAQNGMTSMLIWVFADNPARRFYERLGGAKVDEKQFEIGGVALTEVAYGWADTSAVRGNLAPQLSQVSRE
jgi:GNAT superfamily N-acetyltransferase